MQQGAWSSPNSMCIALAQHCMAVALYCIHEVCSSLCCVGEYLTACFEGSCVLGCRQQQAAAAAVPAFKRRQTPSHMLLRRCCRAAAVASACRHLKDLLADQARCEALTKEDLGLYIDFSRQRATQDTIKVRHVQQSEPDMCSCMS
jgi:hypothetical protein